MAPAREYGVTVTGSWTDLLAPPIVAAVIAGSVAVAVSWGGIWAQHRRENEFRRQDRIRTAATGLIEAATDVGEGDAAAQSRVRRNYHLLLLETQSVDVQQSSRKLVRTSWNVAQQATGKTRLRDTEFTSASKEVRASILPLVSALRQELSLKPIDVSEPER